MSSSPVAGPPVRPVGPGGGGKPRRGAGAGRGGSYTNLVRTLAVLGVVIAGVVLVMTPRGARSVLTPVPYATPVAALRRLAPYHVLAPVGLPRSWVPNHVHTSVRPGGIAALDLGFYLKTDRTYAALEESNGSPAAFLQAQSVLGPVLYQLTEGGRSWDVRRTDQGPALVATPYAGVTVVLDGGANLADLELLARSLR